MNPVGRSRQPEPGTQKPVIPAPEPGNRPEQEPGNAPAPPDTDRPLRKQGTVSDPDFRTPGGDAVSAPHGMQDGNRGDVPAAISPERPAQGGNRVYSDPDW